MRHYGDGPINSHSGVRVVGHNVVDHVLQDEEEQGKNDADLGPGDEDLNEECLDDQQNIEQEEDHEWNIIRDVAESPGDDGTADEMDDNIDGKEPDKPGEVVDP